MPNPELYGSGTVPQRGDTKRMLLVKIVLAEGASSLSGAGSPENVVAAPPGATYVNTANGDLWVKQTGTGNTGWVLVVAGAGVQYIYSGAGAPVAPPAGAEAIYIQTDSVPPGLYWSYYGGAWH